VKILGREPALVIGFLAALISLAGTFGFRLLDPDQAGLWIVAINAVAAAATAFTVRPISPAAFTYAVGAIVAVSASYGLELAPETVSAINGVVVSALILLTRNQVSPVDTAVTQPSVNPLPEAVAHEAESFR
jgi:hypothetical protein